MTQGLYFAFSLARSTASRAGAVTQAATSKLLLLCDALKAGGIQIQDIRGSKKIPLFLRSSPFSTPHRRSHSHAVQCHEMKCLALSLPFV